MHTLRKQNPGSNKHLSCRITAIFFVILSLTPITLLSIPAAAIVAGEPLPSEKHGISAESLLSLRQGREYVEKERYRDAAAYLDKAYHDLPQVRDYILFFKAKALLGMERYNESDSCIAELIRQFPDSPLLRKARALQLHTILLTKKSFSRISGLPPSLQGDITSSSIVNSAISHLEAFMRDYPDDPEMAFSLARLYKLMGNSEKARKLFVQEYISNGPFAEAAYREISPSDISSRDLLLKASNYLKSFESKEAEQLIRIILPHADKSLKGELHLKLGLSLFRQKKYSEASSEFLKGGDIYSASRAYFRAGDLSSFSDTIARLVSMEDRRAGNLMLAHASKMRRGGKTGDALDMYHAVKFHYPSLTEDALWGIAWTNYRTKEYRNALDYFSRLTETFSSSRSLYWKRKTIDQLRELPGEGLSSQESEKALLSPKAVPTSFAGNDFMQTPNSSGIRQKTEDLKDDFYSLLAKMRSRGELSLGTRMTASNTRPEFIPITQPLRKSGGLPPLDRFVILQTVGMEEDAATELSRIAKSVSQPDALLEIVYLLQKTGAYKKSFTLFSRISESGTMHDKKAEKEVLYPFAFWPAVKEASLQYQVDPLLVLSVIREESRYDPSARSVAGAIGLMQLMPQTARTLDKKLGKRISGASDLTNVKINIVLGTYYLQNLLKEFGSFPIAIAAYNAGEEKVREWIRDGRYASIDEFIEDIPYDETRNYVKKVLTTYATYISLAEGKRNN